MPYDQHPNDYINRLANLPYEMGPARPFYKNYLKADKQGTLGSMGFNRYFDAQAAKQNSAVDAQFDPLAVANMGGAGGLAAQGYRDRQKSINNQNINMDRFGYAQGMVQNSASGLAQIWADKNRFNSSNLQAAGALENQRYNYYQKPSFFQTYAQLLSGAAQGASQFGAAGA